MLRPDGEPVAIGGVSPAQAPDMYFAGFRFGLKAPLPYITADARAIAFDIFQRRSKARGTVG